MDDIVIVYAKCGTPSLVDPYDGKLNGEPGIVAEIDESIINNHVPIIFCTTLLNGIVPGRSSNTIVVEDKFLIKIE